MLAVGGVVSKRIVFVELAVLPALSWACTWTVYVPSIETVTDGVQVVPSRETPWLARPELPSDELAVMATAE
jgi:hypothetical protein